MDNHRDNKGALDKGDKKIIFWLIIVGIFIYTFTLTGSFGNFEEITKDFPGGSHQKSAYVQMLSLKNTQSIVLEKSYANSGIPDIGYYKEKFYSFFPIGRSLTSIPFFLIGSTINLGQVFVYSGVALFGLLTSILIYISMRQIFKSKRQTAIFASSLYSFISFSLVSTTIFLQHEYSSFFFILTFYLVWKFKNSSSYLHTQATIIWILYGISWFYDYPNIFILAPVMLYFLIVSLRDKDAYTIRSKKLKIFIKSILVLILMISFHFAYNNLVYGDIFRFSNILPQYTGSNYETLASHSDEIAESKKAINAFEISGILDGLYIFFIDKNKSLFSHAPIFIFIFLVPFVHIRKLRLETNILWLNIAVTTLFYASFHDPTGGESFGPRYLTTTLLSMSILIGLWYEKYIYSKLVKITVLILSILTLAQTLSGTIASWNGNLTSLESSRYGIRYFQYILNGNSQNFIYTEFLSSNISLLSYYIVILTIISIILIYLFYKKLD